MATVQIAEPPELEPSVDLDDWWRVLTDYRVSAWPHTYTVPQGFETDGASIPRFLWSCVGHPFDSELLFSALVHDAGYNGKLLIDGVQRWLSREECDRLFLRMMTGCEVGRPGRTREVSVGSFRRWAIYRAVRMFGGWSYKGDK